MTCGRKPALITTFSSRTKNSSLWHSNPTKSKRYLSRKTKIEKDLATIPCKRSIFSKTFLCKMETQGIRGLIKSTNRTTAFLSKSNIPHSCSKYSPKFSRKKGSHNGTKMSCSTDLNRTMKCWMKMTWTSCSISSHLMTGKILKVKAFSQKWK